jgi:hypothetical protein
MCRQELAGFIGFGQLAIKCIVYVEAILNTTRRPEASSPGRHYQSCAAPAMPFTTWVKIN